MLNEDDAGNPTEKMMAAEDFNKARNKAFLSQIQHLLNPGRDKLLSFYDVKDILKPRGESYKGMQSVPINMIVGSEGRYRDFNKYFLPRSEFIRARWESIDRAQIMSISLPPIQLYEIGGAYFVRDGNHRVSVARSQGGEEIDAEVISLDSEITIVPSMTTDDLRKAVIEYEKRLFSEKTAYEQLTGDKKLDFSIPGRYDTIYKHITGHKYFLNQNKNEEISFEEAIVSWYREIYAPIIKIIDEDHICLNFPGQTRSDLYVYIVKHWDFLKKKNGVYLSARDAAGDYSRKYGKKKGIFFRFVLFILNLFAGKKNNGERTR
ncbi:MAG: transcriptional regulator [Treponema sp.]|jgi:hypothetical protein|nr:transcriptional regulator [Treponema sp.]